MASILGQLLVELGINTVAFKEGLDKSTYQAKQFANQVKGDFKELGGSISNLASSFTNFGPAAGIIDAVSASFKTLNLSMTGVGAGTLDVISGIGIAVVGLGAGATAAAAGLGTLAVAGAKTVEELALMSEKTGISIRDLQTLKAAGESVNVPLESMTAGFRKFEQALSGGGKGAAATEIVLKSLGVTAHEPNEALLQVADAISKIEDPTVRASDAVILFGRSGLNMLPVLEKGRDGMKEFSNIVDQFGTHIGGNAVKSTEAWKKATVELSTAWDGFKVSAIGALPAVTGLIHFAAEETAGWGFAISKTVDGFKDLISLTTTGKLSTTVTATVAAPKEDAAKEKADKAKQEAADKLHATQKQMFEDLKAGGEAQLALQKAQEAIAEFIAADDYKDAAALQAKIPALEDAAKLEKQRRDAMLNLPKATGAALSELNTSVTKAYATALQGQTAASIEAAAAQDALAAIEKFEAKGKEQGIANTKAFQAALAQVGAAARSASLLVEAFKEAGADNKGLIAFTNLTNEQVKSLEAQSDVLGRVAQAQEAEKAKLDPFKNKLAEVIKAYDDIRSKLGDTNPQVEKLGAIVAQQAAEFNKATTAVDKYNAALQAKAFSTELDKLNVQISAQERYNDVLLKSGSTAATVAQFVEKMSADLSLNAGQREKLTAAEEKALLVQQQMAAANKAAGLTTGVSLQLTSYQQEIAALQAIVAANKGNVQIQELVHQGLLQINADYLELQAKSGGVLAGLTAGFAKFNASTETWGATFSKVTEQALTGFSTSFADLITKGKANWQSLVDSMEQALLKSAIQKILSSLFSSIGGALSGQGGFLGSLGSIFTGKAGGGDVTPGKTYMVGESGPELLKVGSAGASIVPNGQFGGGSNTRINQSINISTPNLDGFSRSQGQIAAQLQHAAAKSIGHLT